MIPDLTTTPSCWSPGFLDSHIDPDVTPNQHSRFDKKQPGSLSGFRAFACIRGDMRTGLSRVCRAVGLLVLAGCASNEPAARPQEYQPTVTFLSTGSAGDGREVFLALRCNTCHEVAGEQTAPPRVKLPGPQLGTAQALQSSAQIANSIAGPSHFISREQGPWLHGPGSPMGDYTRVMTVHQLMDLVAYVRSLPSGK